MTLTTVAWIAILVASLGFALYVAGYKAAVYQHRARYIDDIVITDANGLTWECRQRTYGQ